MAPRATVRNDICFELHVEGPHPAFSRTGDSDLAPMYSKYSWGTGRDEPEQPQKLIQRLEGPKKKKKDIGSLQGS